MAKMMEHSILLMNRTLGSKIERSARDMLIDFGLEEAEATFYARHVARGSSLKEDIVILLTKEDLKLLIRQKQDGPFTSIYMPTYRAGPGTRENPIRFKNLVEEAENRLIDMGLRSSEARKLLEPAKKLIEDYDFWQQQNDGLAMFLAPELFRHYRLPLNFEELVVVTDRFHLKPLMPLLSDDGQYYVLALSQNEVKLFQGSRYSIKELELYEEIPTSLSEALRFDLPQKQQQFHTATATPGNPGGRRPTQYHGHGVGTDEEKDNLLRFFQKIDKGLHSFLKNNDSRPLVLAGVEYLFPIYQEANTYPNLISDNGVTGNPEHLKPEMLHQQAWQVVEPLFKQVRQKALAQYKELANTEQASKDARTILPAARFGKVETLFVAVERQLWGAFDADTNTVRLHQEGEIGDEDLLNFAAVQTLLYGGTVYAVSPSEVPDDTLMAAVFRYESKGPF